jgi:serine/threonine-protein kinase
MTRVFGASKSAGLPRKFGKYSLLRKLADGGMAEVYLALYRPVAGFEKLVVIKRLASSSTSYEAARGDMLLDEARTAARLSHPNIVQTFDAGYIDGMYYIAMAHIRGENLRTIAREVSRRGSGFPLQHAISIVIGLCAGLAYAHEKCDLNGAPLNIIHRDISPQNVLVTMSGDVKIVDFGVAKSQLRFSDESQAGEVKGKPAYMSPEQALGKPIDLRSDVFAVGILLYELTTGIRLFKRDSLIATLRRVTAVEYKAPSAVRPGYPPALETIVSKALARDREARYASAHELRADLEQFARAHDLVVSQQLLATWMHGLFGQKWKEQSEQLSRLKDLADQSPDADGAAATESPPDSQARQRAAADASIEDPRTQAPAEYHEEFWLHESERPPASTAPVSLVTSRRVLHARPRRAVGWAALTALLSLGALIAGLQRVHRTKALPSVARFKEAVLEGVGLAPDPALPVRSSEVPTGVSAGSAWPSAEAGPSVAPPPSPSP